MKQYIITDADLKSLIQVFAVEMTSPGELGREPLFPHQLSILRSLKPVERMTPADLDVIINKLGVVPYETIVQEVENHHFGSKE